MGMSTERKKAGVWPWIVALLIGLPVLYVASFGPACWLYGNGIIPARTGGWAYRAYEPLVDWTLQSKHPVARALWAWSALGCRQGAMTLWLLGPADEMP
jgi:hypothetical protein